MTQHEELELLRALAAPEQHDQLEQTAGKDVHTDTAKNNLQGTGTPTLPRPQPGAPAPLTPRADRVCAPHALGDCHVLADWVIEERVWTHGAILGTPPHSVNSRIGSAKIGAGMDVISILLSGFVGALLATWIGEWLRRRDRFTTAVFALQHELGRNAEMVRFIFHPERLGLEPHDASELELPGPLFETRAWHEHGAIAGPRIARRDWSLWRDAMGAYMVLESYNRSYGGSISLDGVSDGVAEALEGLAEKLEFIADELARFFPVRLSTRYFRDFVYPKMRDSEQAD